MIITIRRISLLGDPHWNLSRPVCEGSAIIDSIELQLYLNDKLCLVSTCTCWQGYGVWGSSGRDWKLFGTGY